MAEASCLACGGTVAWFHEVNAYRHTWVPDGTTAHAAVLERHDGSVAPLPSAAGFTAEIEDEGRDLGRRIEAERAEIEARGRAMRLALGAIEPYQRPRLEMKPPPEFEMRTGTTLDGVEFTYPWLLEPTWVNADGWPVRVTPGTGAKSAAAKSDRLDEHPAPSEPMREAFDSEMPDRARTWRTLASDHGWAGVAGHPVPTITYSRGYKPDVHRRASHTRLVDVVVLKATRERNREAVVVVWEDGRYDAAYHLRPGGLPVNLKAAEVKTVLTAQVLLCSTCGEPPHTHPGPDNRPGCFTTTPGGAS